MKKSVFLIDDDDDVRDVVAYALEEDGFQVTSFEDGSAGYQSLDKLPLDKHPGLIIVDYMMPKMDGMKFIDQIKTHHSLNHIPILLCSAKGSEEVPSPLPQGVSQIIKPMELDHLLNVVRSHFA